MTVEIFALAGPSRQEFVAIPTSGVTPGSPDAMSPGESQRGASMMAPKTAMRLDVCASAVQQPNVACSRERPG